MCLIIFHESLDRFASNLDWGPHSSFKYIKFISPNISVIPGYLTNDMPGANTNEIMCGETIRYSADTVEPGIESLHTNSTFKIPISLQPNIVDIFKL